MDRLKDDGERRLHLQAEAEAVLADPSFRRSPTLSALLRYLVNETIAGRGEDLKSYTIAVDGLGRSVDFDPSSDSSARVQMIRLRKALESYYAKNAPSDRLCLYVQAGSYVVRIAIPSIAYPTMYRLQEVASAQAPTNPTTDKSLTGGNTARRNPSTEPDKSAGKFFEWVHKWRGSTGIAAGICIAAMAFFGYQYAAMPETASFSPVVKIMPIATGGELELMPLVGAIRNAYEADLPRFKAARVRIGRRSDQAHEQKEAYRLNTRLVVTSRSHATLYVSVEESGNDTVLWNQSVLLPVDPVAASAQLTPLLGDIMGPVGAVTLNETVRLRDSTAGGYPCMLKYFEFIRSRDPRLESPLDDCFGKPVQEQSIAPTLLGMRAMFEIERSSSRVQPKSAIKRSVLFARQAVNANPRDPWANFAMATASYLARDCPAAIVYTDRTLDQHSVNPVFTAALAALSPSCNHPNAKGIFDQALLAQSPLIDRGRLLLTFAAVSQNRIDKIPDIKPSVPPETTEQLRFYYAAETVISASEGRIDEANRHWQRFSALCGPKAHTADQKLANVMIIPEWRSKLIAFLKQSGVTL